MSWRSILGAAPAANSYPQYSQYSHNSGEVGGFEDIGDIGDRVLPVEEAPPAPPPPMPSNIPADLTNGLSRLCEMSKPNAFSPARWAGIKDDAAKLVVNHGETLAAAGWTVAELFSVHRRAPEARQDCKGVAMLIHGRAVDGVSAESVTLRAYDGARLTVYRRPPQPGQAMLWELK